MNTNRPDNRYPTPSKGEASPWPLPPIQYFSTLPQTVNGGGNYVVCASLYAGMARFLPGIQFCHLQPDRAKWWPSLVSKLQRRAFHVPSKVTQYSPEILSNTAAKLGAHFEESESLPFFKGVTPWIGWTPDRPYAAYTDVAFATILENQNSRSNFRTSDLDRILSAEQRFLERASAVFFESQWGLNHTKEAYSLGGSNLFVAGRAGLFELQERDCRSEDSFALLTVAKHFKLKGGDIAFEAYRALKAKYPALSWDIVGGPPDFNWKEVDGIRYHGFLRPDHPEERRQYRGILRNSFLLVHPTREDTNPLVISEAAAFGCPSISVDRFAIPELIDNGETGVLLPRDPSPDLLASVIKDLLNDEITYRKMREATWQRAQREDTWRDIAAFTVSKLAACLNAD